MTVEDEQVHILREGNTRKFMTEVEQITFSGDRAAETGQVVLYVTERCVLERSPAGLELIESRPGVDFDPGVFGQMDFQPPIRNVRPMDPRLFRNAPMGLDHALLGRNLADR